MIIPLGLSLQASKPERMGVTSLTAPEFFLLLQTFIEQEQGQFLCVYNYKGI